MDTFNELQVHFWNLAHANDYVGAKHMLDRMKDICDSTNDFMQHIDMLAMVANCQGKLETMNDDS